MARRIATPHSPGARRPPPGPPAPSGSGALGPSALDHVAGRLVARLTVLDGQLDAGGDQAWSAYLDVARTLAVVLPLLAPGQHRGLLTTAELAAQLGISSKTLRRRKALGLLQPALEHGRLFRWRANQGVQ